jgi:hypothetical protein
LSYNGRVFKGDKHMFIKAKAACLLLMAIFATGSLQAQSVVRGPYLQMQTDDGLTIHWRTDTDTESVVRYGTSPGSLINTASNTGSRTEHAVDLSGLGSAQKFWYWDRTVLSLPRF